MFTPLFQLGFVKFLQWGNVMGLTKIFSKALINARVSQFLPQPFWLPVSSPPARLDLRSKHISDLLSQVPLRHHHTNPVINISPLHKYISEHRPTSYWIIFKISFTFLSVQYVCYQYFVLTILFKWVTGVLQFCTIMHITKMKFMLKNEQNL